MSEDAEGSKWPTPPDGTGSDGSATAAVRGTALGVRRWFLVSGRRFDVTGLLLCLVFLSLVGLALVRPFDMRELVEETTAVRNLFTTLLRGVILLVSIVVSINSVVLSQEITDVESQQKRVEAAVEYRRHIEDLIQADVSPAWPDHFLGAILLAIWRQTQTLSSVAADADDAEFSGRVDDFVEKVAADVAIGRERLRGGHSNTIDVLLAGIDYDFSGQLRAVRQLRREYGGESDRDDLDVLDDLVETLEFFAVAHEYFKSLYYKRELARLSSRLLYVSLPVIVFTSYVILALDAHLFPETSFLGVSPLLVFVSFAYTIALAPFLVLTSYIVRLATVTLRTLTAGPFVVDERDDVRDLDWSTGGDVSAALDDEPDDSEA